MKIGVSIAGLMLAAASLVPLHAPAAGESPQHGSLPHGGSYIIHRDNAIGAAAIDLWFRAPGAGYDNGLPGLARLAATAAAAAPLESGKSLVTMIRAAGGSFTIDAYPDLIGVGAVVPAASARRIVAAMTAAYFAPSIDDAALKTAQRDMAVLGAQKRFSSDELLHDALFATIFPAGAAHYPAIPDAVTDLTRITTAQAGAFARRAFRSGNATLTLTGNVDPESIGAVTAGSAGGPDAPVDSAPGNPPSSPVSIVAAVTGTGMAWIGPPIADQKSATALDFVADYLFRDETGVVTKAISDTTDSYISAQFITLHDPGIMLVTVGGSGAEKLGVRVHDALEKMQQPLDSAAFAAAREAFLYHIASDTQNPAEQADNLGWYASEGDASYAPGDPASSYWKAANALDPAFVASVVKRYLARPFVVELVPPSAAKESAS
ncbi:MAG: hypothetical protein M3R51_06330 [Candidatus Eremiobacteraeota bacterium]|nr:hypothetical protein [Candidatus Eremiobacteraeota bacterium]